MGPFKTFTRSHIPLSGKFFPFPSKFNIASNKEENSCPLGTALNFIPVILPFFSKTKDKPSPSPTRQEIFSERADTSSNSSNDSARLPCSGETEICEKVFCLQRAKYCI